jgi:hypothetical protein
LWAGVAVLIAKVSSGAFPGVAWPRKNLDDIELLATLYQVVSDHRETLRENYTTTPTLHLNSSATGLQCSLAPQENECVRVLDDLLQKLFPVYPRNECVMEINRAINAGYQELIKSGLLTDPIIETSIALAILSFVPFSMTRRTKKGRLAYLKMRSAIWSYERQRTTGGEVRTDWRFEAARIAKALKSGVATAFHELTKDAGEEPTDEQSGLTRSNTMTAIRHDLGTAPDG